MNNKRRKAISKIADEIEDLKGRLESLRDEEQDSFDNIPENMQESERAQNSENAIGELENAISSLEDCFEYLNCSQV